MHEFGLMESVLKCVNESARDGGAKYVTDIYLSVGELTQAVPEAMEFAFDVLKEGTLSENAKLNISYIEGRQRCLDCEHEYKPEQFRLTCPNCGSLSTESIAGKELHINKIEIESG
jgi:hydrogenase nickel incorporation protein HypA/HybF